MFKTPHTHDDIEMESTSNFFVKVVTPINSDDDAKALIGQVQSALLSSSGSFVNIANQVTFDIAYSVTLCAKRISPDNYKNFVDVLSTSFTKLMSAIGKSEVNNSLHRQKVSPTCVEAFKMYTFLLSINAKLGIAAIKKECTHTTSTASNRTRKQEFVKKQEVHAVKSIIHTLLAASKTNFKRYWTMGLPDEDFLALFTKPALSIFETESLIQNSDVSCRNVAVQLCKEIMIK